MQEILREMCETEQGMNGILRHGKQQHRVSAPDLNQPTSIFFYPFYHSSPLDFSVFSFSWKISLHLTLFDSCVPFYENIVPQPNTSRGSCHAGQYIDFNSPEWTHAHDAFDVFTSNPIKKRQILTRSYWSLTELRMNHLSSFLIRFSYFQKEIDFM